MLASLEEEDVHEDAVWLDVFFAAAAAARALISFGEIQLEEPSPGGRAG